MRPIPIAGIVVLGLALLAACQDPQSTGASQVVGPTPSFKADQNWVRSSFFVDVTLFVDCLGENVRFHGEVPFAWHRVTSSSGGFNYHFQGRPGAVSPPFFADAQTSGTRYVFQGGPYNEMFHAAAGEVFMFGARELYVSEDGDALIVTYQLHVTINANGELAVLKIVPVERECRDK